MQLQKNEEVADVKKPNHDECAGCKLAGFCHADCDAAEKHRDKEVKAIWLCLVVPCVLFLAVVVAVSTWVSTLAGCMSGIVALAAYFGLFYLLKDRGKSA